MNSINKQALDRWITGNYGEDHPDNRPEATMSEDNFPSRWPRDARIECANRDAEIERLRADLAVAKSLARAQGEKTVVAKKRIVELEREHRWMAAKIGDQEYDAMREAMIGGSDE